jgi:hypothetical protein
MRTAPATIRNIGIRAHRKFQRTLGLPVLSDVMKTYELDPGMLAAIAASLPNQGPVSRAFFNHTGRVIHKWVHFLEIYDKHFGQYENSAVKMLEIGVYKGGSLEMWRDVFGPAATIFGVDIDPACANVFDPPNQVRIGSQDDQQFLRQVAAEMGQPDLVLDDGSHVGRHQWDSFEVLFPLLEPGGTYMLEDLHTSYWSNYEGGYRSARSGIGLVKQIIDDMHGWYHNRQQLTMAQTWVESVTQYDSIAVIKKCRLARRQPGHIHTG